MTIAIHHLHKRKRIHEKHEKYPHPNKWKRYLDKLVYVVGILGPILTIPQIIKIWINQSAGDISIISWIAYFFGSMILLTYGVVHKEKPLIVMYSAWILINFMIVISILIYG